MLVHNGGNRGNNTGSVLHNIACLKKTRKRIAQNGGVVNSFDNQHTDYVRGFSAIFAKASSRNTRRKILPTLLFGSS